MPDRGPEVPASGRRERNKDMKRAAIFDAAAALFETHGFSAVTTQQIAERADVAAGTVFRYASSKAELLLMVYNVEFERAMAHGSDEAARRQDREAAVTALLAPVLEWGSTHAENTLAYQRELLFGTANERYRAEGLQLAADLVSRIAAIIGRREPVDDDAVRAARSVFGALHLALIEVATGVWHIDDPVAALATQVQQIIAGADRTARHPDDHRKGEEQ